MPVSSLKSSQDRPSLTGAAAPMWFAVLLAILFPLPLAAGEPAGSWPAGCPSGWWADLMPHCVASDGQEKVVLAADFCLLPAVPPLERPADFPLSVAGSRVTGSRSAGLYSAAFSRAEPVLAPVDEVFRECSPFCLTASPPGLTDFAGRCINRSAATQAHTADLRQLAGFSSGWPPGEKIVIRGVAPEDFLVPVASRSSRAGQLLRFRADYISENLDEFRDVARLRGNLQLTLQSRLAFDGEFNHWADPPAGYDDLWTGDANLVYVFGQGTPVRLKIGGGANWQSSSGEMEYGLNSTYGLDISIKRPFIVSGSLDIGTLDGDRVFHGQATLGALMGILEIYAGYDWLDFGSLKMNGPVAGAGIWF